MRNLIRMRGFRRTRMVAFSLMLAGGLGASVAAGNAPAGPCGSPVVAGTACTMTGTLTLISGSMTLTAPSSLEWSGTVNGLDQHLVDVEPGDQSYLVNDSTGGAPGWHVTVSATTFTSGANTLLNAGTFSNNGSLTSMTATVGPTATCLSGSTCVLPTNQTTYPVAITTAATAPVPVDLYNAALGTGLGSIVIGGASAADPVGWWLNVPSNVLAGTYTSTVTMEIIAGP
jgi:hypothetical protein